MRNGDWIWADPDERIADRHSVRDQAIISASAFGVLSWQRHVPSVFDHMILSS
jgi:hypothetical protein